MSSEPPNDATHSRVPKGARNLTGARQLVRGGGNRSRGHETATRWNHGGRCAAGGLLSPEGSLPPRSRSGLVGEPRRCPTAAIVHLPDQWTSRPSSAGPESDLTPIAIPMRLSRRAIRHDLANVSLQILWDCFDKPQVFPYVSVRVTSEGGAYIERQIR